MSVYHEELKIKETELLREVQADLPPFLREFFRGIAQTTSTKTRLAYAYDLRVFFRYLYEEHDKLGGMETRHLEVDALDQITSEDIECYLEYLSYYIAPDQNQPEQQTAHHNDEKARQENWLLFVPCINISIKKERSKPILPPLWIRQKSTKRKLPVWMSTKWQTCWMQ